MAEQVKLPKAMLDHLEEQAVAYKEVMDLLKVVSTTMGTLRVKAIVTEPPSGSRSEVVVEAINKLLELANA